MKHAFTRIELLAVLAVAALLVGVKLPSLGHVQSMSKITQCAANLKADAMAIQLYAGDSRNRLPFMSAGNWVWDMPTAIVSIYTNYGMRRAQMFDPGAAFMNSDQFWSYSASYRVTGYAWCFSGLSALFYDDQNVTLGPNVISLVGNDPQLTPYANSQGLLKIDSSKRVLVADAIISSPGQYDPSQAASYQWVKHSEVFPTGNPTTAYGVWQGGSSPHVGNTAPAANPFGSPLPLGGNEAMLDGHVKWCAFDGMEVHSTMGGYLNANQGDCFWWQADPGKL